MQWFNTLLETGYYNPPKGNIPCYQEQLLYASDLILQGSFNAGSGNYSIDITVLQPDGNFLEIATSNFSYYFAVNPYTSQHTVTIKLNTFSAAMCSNKCFILSVTVTDISGGNIKVFNKYTNQYKVNECCDIARGINVVQDGISDDYFPFALVIDAPVDTPIPTATDLGVGTCGQPLIRIISKFDCYDKFSDNLYSETTVLSGTYFPFVKVSTIQGRVVKRPREIVRQYSYNCQLQRVESKRVYLLEGLELFPSWKMDEIEGQLHANEIFIQDVDGVKEYQYAGGTPFNQANNCFELFRLQATLEDCTIRQISGCAEPCIGGNNFVVFFAIPTDYGGGVFYNQSGEIIANDYDGLLEWFNSQNGVTGVEDMDLTCLTCDIYGAIKITGLASLPSFIYYNIPVSTNKVYQIEIDTFCDICGVIGGTGCAIPVISSLTIEDLDCATPVIYDLTIEDITTEVVDVFSYDPWVVSVSPVSEGALYAGAVSLDITSKNNTTFIGLLGEDVSLSNNIIGTLSVNGRPILQRVITNIENGTVPAGASVSINPDGTISLSGTFVLTADNELEVIFTDLLYNI